MFQKNVQTHAQISASTQRELTICSSLKIDALVEQSGYARLLVKEKVTGSNPVGALARNGPGIGLTARCANRQSGQAQNLVTCGFDSHSCHSSRTCGRFERAPGGGMADARASEARAFGRGSSSLPSAIESSCKDKVSQARQVSRRSP